jgi:YegS/Rv2252/BmrU family lipid kinase
MLTLRPEKYHMIFFIINIKSGSKSTSSKAQLIQILNKIENSSLHFTEFSGHGGELAKLAISQQVSKIIVVGGDGTINEVASELIHTKIPIGIIPIGSGNGLARHLKIPMDFKSALNKALHGNHIAIDSLMWNEKPFFCTAGIGFDAYVAEEFSKKQNRGFINYIKSTLRSSLRYVPIQVEINNKIEYVFSLSIANANQFGNNAYISPLSNIQDAHFEVVKISPLHFIEKAQLGIRLFLKTIQTHPKVAIKSHDLFEFSIKKGICYHIDGESLISEDSKVKIIILPKSLVVVN